MNSNKIKDELTNKEYEQVAPKIQELDTNIEEYIKARVPEYRKSSIECAHVISIFNSIY